MTKQWTDSTDPRFYAWCHLVKAYVTETEGYFPSEVALIARTVALEKELGPDGLLAMLLCQYPQWFDGNRIKPFVDDASIIVKLEP